MSGKFAVFIDNDLHPMDLLSCYKLGEFDDCALAVAACEEFVDSFLLASGSTESAEGLLAAYRAYGQSPYLKSDSAECSFWAWDYAQRRCRELAGDLWNEKDGGCRHAHRYTLSCSVDAVRDGLRQLGESRTYGAVGASGDLASVVRFRDGTSIRIVREEGQEAISATVVIPREHAYTSVWYRRGLSDDDDAHLRFAALSGLFQGAGGGFQDRVRLDDGAEVIGLDGLGLTAIPDELWLHPDAEVLSLTGNWLTALPPEIGRLTKLQELDLSGNRLTALPKELFELRGLKQLLIRSNFLESLPAEIGQLTNLEYLDLSGNLVTELPREIGDLKSLRWLRLSKNRLVRLPIQLGRLSGLTSLQVDRNRIAQLPVQLGKLANLGILWVHHNRLTSLPLELGRLTKLQPGGLSRGSDGRGLPSPTAAGLMIEGNPLVDPPPDMKSTVEIVAHLRAKLKAREEREFIPWEDMGIRE